MSKIEEAKKILKEHNQEHIKVENEEIANQVLSIDFEQLDELYEEIKNPKRICNLESIEPVKAVNPKRLAPEEIKRYIDLGEKEIKSGKYAVAIMAGGQGTRLGHPGPKGTYKMVLNNEEKSLFEIIVGKLKAANQKYNIELMCYIMTSPENNEETIKFFEENKYFGYKKENIMFFVQNEMPLLDKQGKLVIGEDHLIKLASDGNGGIFSSMAKEGVIDDMKKRGIEWIFIGSVDNLLVKYVDELLLGLAMDKKVKIATRTIIKNSPYEKVGILCKKDKKVKVIEYTEVPKQMRFEVDENEEFVYGESHIMCNLYSLEAIEKSSTKELRYHIAEKKTKYLDENGKLVIPEKENCYKFEKFIFDSFCLFDDIAILRGKREEDFAPIKNKEGIDSPQTAKALYEAYINT